VADVVPTPDGRALVIADIHDSILVWELASGKERFRLAAKADKIALSPDGRVLAWAGKDRVIRLVDLHSGRELRRLEGHPATIMSMRFMPDGKSLVSGGIEGAALVWDLEDLKLPTPARAGQAVTNVLWDHLADADARQAWKALQEMAAEPESTLAFVRKQLRPVTAPDGKRLDQLVADLDSNDFAKRQAAGDELEKLAELAEPELTRVLAGKPSLEMRSRVEQLLERLVLRYPVSGERLRGIRAVEVLETIGSAEAQAVLKELSQGAEGSRLTREAKSSLRRLSGMRALDQSR
jgi:hypothetical protein